jgi:hypothetical protein
MEWYWLASCKQCGEPLGTFFELSELKIFVTKNPKCSGPDCPVRFKILSNGQLWDVSYEEHPDSSYEHYLVHKAIKDAIGFQAQSIFCYEDIGKGNGFARYPHRRIVFEFEHG